MRLIITLLVVIGVIYYLANDQPPPKPKVSHVPKAVSDLPPIDYFSRFMEYKRKVEARAKNPTVKTIEAAEQPKADPLN
jgi:hypothetical protein